MIDILRSVVSNNIYGLTSCAFRTNKSQNKVKSPFFSSNPKGWKGDLLYYPFRVWEKLGKSTQMHEKYGIKLSTKHSTNHVCFTKATTVVLLSCVLLNCTTGKKVAEEVVLYGTKDRPGQEEHWHNEPLQVPVPDVQIENVSTITVEAPTFTKQEAKKLQRRKNQNEFEGKVSPVALKIVENYQLSENKEPGGHCLTACKSRFLKAYEDVHGTPVYADLPEDIASRFYEPGEVFDNLYASTFGPHKGWRTLPRKYRGRGGAGAIAHAGMGTLVDWFGIWSGELRPGAIMQVWRHRSDYKKVVRGQREKDFDPFGHSFIFLGYERDDEGNIIGLHIADQGYQSHRSLKPRDYEVWWGVNLEV